MKSDKVIKELKAKYPNKNIVFDPPNNPTEIIVEIEPTRDHPERSLALAVVGRSKPHYHKMTTEIYEVVKGILTIDIDGIKHILKKGEKITIEPDTIHYVEGKECWFLTHSKPGWTFEDHIMKEEK